MTYDSDEEAHKDWQSISPIYRTRERLDEMMKLVRHTATTVECTRCGNTDPDKFSLITSGYRPTRFAGLRAEESGRISLDGYRCLACKNWR